ncbi:acetyl-CoA acetyltransferase [Phenylobacterium sp.]|uniref:acetyl-CoA acetyltransferase n=1 Tax=Phenylobacterium sp. TaxID=1871053 RepID=UPI0025EDFD96|nr:acetyl-CoA acetyltransferase [Phenylobacterium sp.]MBX3483525.1 acetyl-CoA acetyltransferase [Phenylobacterium sp.]MCW5760703.1 acetyl-CoA acetyltransferase [Phenylobacterium sp.]
MDERSPVLIGAGQFTYRGDPASSPSPSVLLKIAAERAAADAGIGAAGLAAIDSIVVAPSAIAQPGASRSRGAPFSSNAAMQLGAMLAARPRWAALSAMGGNSSQYMINVLAQRIAEGETGLGLAVGCEVLGSVAKRMARGLGFEDWDAAEDLSLDAPPVVGDTRPGVSAYEARHGLDRPINIYPIFENALRARDGRSLPDHAARIGALFARFTEVAAGNPHAWFPIRRSAGDLTTVGDRNRMIGFPYPKFLNAIMEVDQSAGVLIASVAKARELGVPEDRWVYLHGCADAHDIWHVLERQDFHSSPAMRLTGRRAFEMAGIGPDDLGHIDLYSCFPSAVQVGAEELGLSLDDPRGFTVTGGLPYAGGPGNNYAMHAVATMAQRLRDAPGSWGLVTANGWYLTKQSTGVYSTTPPQKPFERQDPAVIQREIDALPHPDVIEAPQGAGTIETYTVVHKREGPFMGIVIGRDANGRRFVANTRNDPATLASLEASEQVGRKGTVRQSGGLNIFEPA